MLKRIKESSANKSGIYSLLNAEAGRNIVILGNGPSLHQMEFDKITNPIFIGINGSALIAKEQGFKEQYYVLSDLRFVNDPLKMDILKNNLDSNTKIIVRSELEAKVKAELKQEILTTRALGRDGFSDDLTKGYYFGCTTTMLALQLASYIGGNNIFLCGVDLKYDFAKPRFYEESKIHTIDNFSCVQIHNIRNAYKHLKENNINLFHCSPNSLIKPYLPYYELSK